MDEIEDNILINLSDQGIMEEEEKKANVAIQNQQGSSSSEGCGSKNGKNKVGSEDFVISNEGNNEKVGSENFVISNEGSSD